MYCINGKPQFSSEKRYCGFVLVLLLLKCAKSAQFYVGKIFTKHLKKNAHSDLFDDA